MNGVQNWGEAITASLVELGQRFIDFLPSLLGAIIVFIFGWIVAVSVGNLVEKALKIAKLDQAFAKLGWGSKMSELGISAGVAEFFGGLIKWFLVLVFLMASTNILKLVQVTEFLNSIILYLPNVIVAVIVLAVALLLANFVYNVVKGSTKAAGVVSATLLATISKWSIVIFGVFAALIQLGIAGSLINVIFTGIVAMLSLAGGLAFGLGGKDEAALILRKIREELTERR